MQTLMCGLLGIPPSNGVIPQSPMHTKSLATLKYQVTIAHHSLISARFSWVLRSTLWLSLQLLRNRLVATARRSIKTNASLGQLYNNMQEAYHHMQTPLVYQQPQVREYLPFFFSIEDRTKNSFFPFAGFKRTERINNSSNYINRKPQCSGWWNSVRYRERDWWFVTCWSQRTEGKQLPSIYNGRRMRCCYAYP